MALLKTIGLAEQDENNFGPGRVPDSESHVSSRWGIAALQQRPGRARWHFAWRDSLRTAPSVGALPPPPPLFHPECT